MKLFIVLQVALLAVSFKYGNGQDRRVRIFLESDERILLPKSSKIEILNPVYFYHENYKKAPLKAFKKPIYYGKPVTIPPTSYLNSEEFLETFKDPPLLKQEGVIHPVHSSTSGPLYADNDNVKPVQEHIEDDIKYDFRTNTHSIG